MNCSLQDEYVVLQKELKATIEESHLVQEKYKKLLEQARMDLSNKAAESESIKNQVWLNLFIDWIYVYVIIENTVFGIHIEIRIIVFILYC